MRKASWFNIGSVALGLAFLYLPIVILVIYSFNGSRLVTVWGGWSTRWYAELLNDSALLESAWVTLRIALLSATVATVLGTLAAIALVRFGRFRCRCRAWSPERCFASFRSWANSSYPICSAVRRP